MYIPIILLILFFLFVPDALPIGLLFLCIYFLAPYWLIVVLILTYLLPAIGAILVIYYIHESILMIKSEIIEKQLIHKIFSINFISKTLVILIIASFFIVIKADSNKLENHDLILYLFVSSSIILLLTFYEYQKLKSSQLRINKPNLKVLTESERIENEYYS